MRGIELIPSGELEGMPAVQLCVPAGSRPDYLVAEFVQVWRPGVRALWLSATDWGDPEVDNCLAHFQSDSRTHEMTVWCVRDVLAEAWPSTPLWTVIDASVLLKAPTKLQRLAEDMIRAPFIPRPSELLVKDPAEGNLSPGLLDQMTTNYDPERGAWIELSDPDPRVLERAVGAACAASYGWGVRARGA